MLGNTSRPAGGADIGWLEPLGVGGSLVLMGAGGLFGLPSAFSVDLSGFSSVSSSTRAFFAGGSPGVFSGSSDFLPSHSQLTSVRAVEGVLSSRSVLSLSDSSEVAETSLFLLASLSALLTVLVR